jgi:hypothetical protein
VRCSWSCEQSGYDDESQPLDKHRRKWEHFTSLIKAGTAAEWGGKAAPK